MSEYVYYHAINIFHKRVNYKVLFGMGMSMTRISYKRIYTSRGEENFVEINFHVVRRLEW